MSTRIEQARKAISQLKTEVGIVPFYRTNAEDMAAPGGFEAMDGEHYDIVALQHNMSRFQEAMEVAITALEALVEPVEHDVDGMAWRLLGDPVGQGRGYVGYGKLHADIVKGIKRGIRAERAA